MTTKAKFLSGPGWWEVYLPLAPVPAARPRVSRWGTYYPKTYKQWITDAAKLLQQFWKSADPISDPVSVVVHSVVKRPVKPTREFPRPDVDNFAKAALDAITKAQLIWEDDTQVTLLHTTKRYAKSGEEPHTFVRAAVDEDLLFDQSTGEDVYDLPASDRGSLKEADAQMVRNYQREE